MKKPLLLVFTLFLYLLLSAQQKEKQDQNISSELKKIINQNLTDSTDIVFSFNDLYFLQDQKILRITSIHSSSKTATARIAVKQLLRLIENKGVEFVDVLRQPKEELTTGAFDLTLNKLNLAHNIYRNINGSGIQASVKEQLLDSTDIDWKGRNFNSGVAANTQTSHASIMSTILAGGGNTSLYALGAAPGARLTSSSFTSLLPDADSVYTNYKISVQNHSYGTGIENFYGPDTKAYDISVNKNPVLLHVFSAGNSGTVSSTTGAYANVPGFANITGSFKMAKNIITVGSVDSFNNVMTLSSKGPAYDGRVKPELVAYGEDGSSGAAAITSGTGVLLQQAFQLTHNNVLPSAALIKSILLNSADDVGVKGIDFASGYGCLNAYSAIKTITENRFFENSISNGGTKTFSINIPVNVQQVRLTVVWNDTAATVNAAKALVNNIDALLKLPVTGESWQPWVLNSYPHKDSLVLPAVRTRDTLNTVEQITIDNPQSGTYVLEVAGNKISTASQDFAVAYQIDTSDSFLWIYPTSSDVLEAASANTIRWETNTTATGQIEFSLDGTTWQAAGTINTGQRYFKWSAPDTLSKALLRFVIPSLSKTIVSDTFVISKKLNLKVGFNCPDSFLLSWNKLPANQYQIYQLGQQYLEPITLTTDTIKVFQKNDYSSLYYAVAPKIGNKSGLRSYTLNYTTQGVACYLRTFFAFLQNGTQAHLSAELGSLYNVTEISFQKQTSNGFQTIYTINQPSSLALNFNDSSLVQGGNFYRLQIRLASGQIIYSSIDNVYYLPGNPVLIFPNPARQNEPINILTQEPGKYSIQVFDVNGRFIRNVLVNDIRQKLPALQFSTGMYFVKILSDDGKLYNQKLIVY